MSTGAEARQIGFDQMELAMGAAGMTWAERATAFIISLPRGSAFTADLLRETCGTPDRQNAPGMLIRRAAQQGLLVEAGYQPSERKERHASVNRVWVRS